MTALVLFEACSYIDEEGGGVKKKQTLASPGNDVVFT
jgi:hypothetical protein